ncbi:MAG TPA: hypothetical protein VKY92_03805 [Verrucomicrobiae bacterium]|jgi:hypothetical protein|nr:hypothetical protein [Verrucomicrobiae bacterium]
MKAGLLAYCLLFAARSSLAQGLINFVNGPVMLVSAGGPGQSAAIAGPAGSYFFGLLTAAPGTMDPNQFTFAGI